MYTFAVGKIIWRHNYVVKGFTLLFLYYLGPAGKFFGFIVADNQKVYTVLAR